MGRGLDCHREQHKTHIGNNAGMLVLKVVASFGVMYAWSGNVGISILHFTGTKTSSSSSLCGMQHVILPHSAFKHFSWLDGMCSRALFSPLSVSDCLYEAPEATCESLAWLQEQGDEERGKIRIFISVLLE